MSYFEIVMLAIALSVDAAVLSLTYGLLFKTNRCKNSLLLAFSTGFGQFLLPFIGYFITSFVKSYIAPYASLIVFCIFLYLGIKFVIEAFNPKSDAPACLDWSCLLLVGIATSIDAFSAGISLALFGNKIVKPSVLIGFVTFLNSLLGFYIGGKFKNMPTKVLEVSAGFVLILLGLKALF